MFIKSPLEQFELSNYLAIQLFNLNLSFSNFGFYLALCAAILIFLAVINLLPNNSNIIPQRFGIAMEAIHHTMLSLVDSQIQNNSHSKVNGHVYFPFIWSLFVLILFSNFLGLIPYSYATTAQLIFTLGISLSILVGATILGLVVHKAKFFGLFLPSGTPTPLIPLLVLIEFVSYIARGLSLGIRLGANIIAGHLTMSILGSLIFSFMGLNLIAFVLGFLPITILVAISLLEFGIAFIQAYVFAILTCGFINDSINLH
uniref:ATP synthase F0 subunit 6 n=1 Tax=Schizosaccharomyces osmophilus TaxID=2545709 RepID=UPI00237AB06C|nr:ATP synthase F0 subunit 6 [Schizosaccharomyces osmophilus]WCA44846.1 ATP synthase F0 subunit 6 [Schizosaccharomyces osmophilus]